MKTGQIDYFASRPGGLKDKTVLQLIPSLSGGGSERIALALAEALAHAGARALVAAGPGGLVSELQAKGGIWIPFPARTRNPLAMLMNVQKLAALIRREKIDLVHVHSRASAWSALAATRLTKKPIVTSYHSSYGGRAPATTVYNSIMARGDAVIAHSRFTAALIARSYPWARQNIHVVGAGVDFRDYSPGIVDPGRVAALRQHWGVAAHEHIVLLSARLSSLKGHKVLIEAAHLLTRQGLSHTRFILMGDVPSRGGGLKDLDMLIAKYQLQGIVQRVGRCSDLPAAYLSAAVVVVPSTEPEAFALTAVEAQALGTPVIVSDLGAVAETVVAPPEVPPEARTGWRVPPNHPQKLAEAILQALALGASAKDAIGMRARQHVIKTFSMDQMTGHILALYAGLFEKPAK